jgi:ABC-type Fe3+-hydroxamate transport system substrate-binding protein
LIIANREENLEEDVLWLERFVPTWVSDVRTQADALDLVEHLADITHVSTEASDWVSALKLLCVPKERTRKIKFAYLIWQEPFMAVGSETFVHHMLEAAGFENVVPFVRYPEVSLNQLEEWGPEVLMLSSEPFPFSALHQDALRAQLPGDINVVLVNGELCSWYGPRMLSGIPYLQGLYQILAG